jgi:hypothetical protein
MVLISRMGVGGGEGWEEGGGVGGGESGGCGQKHKAVYVFSARYQNDNEYNSKPSSA